MWGVSVNVVRGSSLVFGTFVLGGGGSVVIGCLYMLGVSAWGYVLYVERVG